MGLFGRRTENDRDAPTAVGTARVTDHDRDHDGVPDRMEAKEERLVDRDGDSTVHQARNADVDRKEAEAHEAEARDAEARAAHERTEARLAARERLAAEQRTKERTDNRESRTVPVVDRDRDGVDDRVETPAPTKMRARASMLATLALMVGMTSVYAALTGRLAPVAVVLGVVGLVLSFGGLSASGKPRVAGGGTALFALLLSVGGAVLGVLAITDATPWLDSDVDQVSRLRDWLDGQFPFMRGW